MMSPITSCLQIENIIPLPVNVESNALTQAWNKELWMWINQPESKVSQLLKIKTSGEAIIVTEIPFMAASMSCNERQMIVTGSNTEGKPLILGLDFNGKVLWEFLFSNLKPITWPVAACRPTPLIAWQEIPGKIETGLLDTETKTLLRNTPISVDAPPAKFYSWKNNIWAAWTKMGKIQVINLVENSQQEVLTDKIHASEFSLGQSKEGDYFAWNVGNHVFWLLPNKTSSASIDLEDASMGTIRLISGGMPLMWVQKSQPGIDGKLEWESTLILPGEKPHTLDDFVFSVAWWQQRVAVVKRSSVLLLKRTD